MYQCYLGNIIQCCLLGEKSCNFTMTFLPGDISQCWKKLALTRQFIMPHCTQVM